MRKISKGPDVAVLNKYNFLLGLSIILLKICIYPCRCSYLTLYENANYFPSYKSHTFIYNVQYLFNNPFNILRKVFHYSL